MFRDVVVADIELGSQIAIDTARYLIPSSKLFIHSTYKRRIVQAKHDAIEISKILSICQAIDDSTRLPEEHYVRFVRYKIYKVISTISTYETHTSIGPVRVHLVTA
jgi:hypothetical protein